MTPERLLLIRILTIGYSWGVAFTLGRTWHDPSRRSVLFWSLIWPLYWIADRIGFKYRLIPYDNVVRMRRRDG